VARRRLKFCPKSETYYDVERMLWDNVWTFVRKYGHHYGTPDEIFSNLCVVFVRAYGLYDDDSPASFTTYLQRKLYGALLDIIKNHHRKANRLPNILALVEGIPQEVAGHDRFRRFLAELSEDARTVVNIVFDTPVGLARIIGSTSDIETIKEARALRARIRSSAAFTEIGRIGE
jgi:hypothetical protein